MLSYLAAVGVGVFCGLFWWLSPQIYMHISAHFPSWIKLGQKVAFKPPYAHNCWHSKWLWADRFDCFLFCQATHHTSVHPGFCALIMFFSSYWIPAQHRCLKLYIFFLQYYTIKLYFFLLYTEVTESELCVLFVFSSNNVTHFSCNLIDDDV